MIDKRVPEDPKGLVFEAYRIDGITAPECRTIFLDWALSLGAERDTRADLNTLLARYSDDHPDHPMTQVLREGLDAAVRPRRRGGWRSRARP